MKSWRTIFVSMPVVVAITVTIAFAADNNDDFHPVFSTNENNRKIVFELRFSKEDSVPSPLDSRGFCHVIDKGKVSFLVADNNLILSVSPGTRMLHSLAIAPVHVSQIRIVWGTIRFPHGVDWDKAPTSREPIGVALSFGNKLRMTCSDSRSIARFIQYAISMISRLINPPFSTVIFLGPPKWHNGMYEGILFKKRIKYFCQNYKMTDSGGTIITELNVDSLYREAFGKEPIRPVNAVSLEADLDGLTDSSCAYIRSITLFGQ